MQELASLAISIKTGDLKKATQELNKLEKAGLLAERGTDKLTKSTSLLNAQTVILGASTYLLGKALKSIVSTGFDYNSSIEQSLAGLTALSVATQNKAIPVAERYNIAQKEAVATLKQLQAINVQTPHTLDQTNKIYKSMYASMKNVNATTAEMVELTRSISIASGAAGIEFQSLLAGVDGLATGTVLANSDLGRFLSSLGLTNETLKESDNVVKTLNNALKDFKAMGTLAEATSNFDNAWSQLTGKMTVDTFAGAKSGLNELSTLLNSMSDEDINNLKNGLNDFGLVALNVTYGASVAVVELTNAFDSLGARIAGVAFRISKGLFLNDIESKALEEMYQQTKNNIKAREDFLDILKQSKDAMEKSITTTNSLATAQAKLTSGGTVATLPAIINEEFSQEDLDWFNNDDAEEAGINFSETIASNLGSGIAKGIQAGVDGDFDFGDMATAFSKTIGQSMVSASISAMTTAAMASGALSAGGAFGVGLGLMAVGSLLGKKDKGESQAEIAQKEFDTFISGLDKASQALNAFGNVGTSISDTIESLQSEIAKQQTKLATEKLAQQGKRITASAGRHGYSLNGTFVSESALEARISATFNSLNSLGNKLSDIVTSSLADTLDLSKLSLSQLTNLTSSIDIEAMKAMDTELNNIALAMKLGTSTAEDNARATEILTNSQFAQFKDYSEAIDLVSESTKNATDTLLDSQRKVNDAMLGSLSYLSELEKLSYANNIYKSAITQEDRVSSSRAIAELSQGTTRTKTDYIPIFQQYINELQKQSKDATLQDVVNKLDEVVNGISSLEDTTADGAIYA